MICAYLFLATLIIKGLAYLCECLPATAMTSGTEHRKPSLLDRTRKWSTKYSWIIFLWKCLLYRQADHFSKAEFSFQKKEKKFWLILVSRMWSATYLLSVLLNSPALDSKKLIALHRIIKHNSTNEIANKIWHENDQKQSIFYSSIPMAVYQVYSFH